MQLAACRYMQGHGHQLPVMARHRRCAHVHRSIFSLMDSHGDLEAIVRRHRASVRETATCAAIICVSSDTLRFVAAVLDAMAGCVFCLRASVALLPVP